MAITLPRAATPFLDGKGYPTSAWIAFFQALLAFVGPNADIADVVAGIIARLEALEEGDSADLVINGPNSVQVDGTPASGAITLRLTGDSTNPGATYYYGTNADGTKGFYEHALSTLGDVDLVSTPPVDQDVLTYDLASETWIPAAGGGGGGTGAISFNVGNNVNIVTTGIKGRLYIPFDCEIVSVHIVANTTGDLILDIWADDFASYPPASGDSICAAAKPTLSTADTYSDSTLTGWITTLTEGDVLLFNVDSCSGISYFSGTLKVTKT